MPCNPMENGGRAKLKNMSFTALLMKIAVYWDMILCRLVTCYQWFVGACCLQLKVGTEV